MKILKYLLIIIAIVLIGGWAYVSTQPNDYDVKRTQLIKAPASMIFNNLNEYKNWKNWGPWYDEDPTIEAIYSDKTSGIGASYSWTSKDGPGNMNTISLVENQSLEQKLQFDDFEPTDVYWNLEEVDDGTNVTWSMKAEKTPFMFKVFAALSGGMDKMLGSMEEKGLSNLNRVIMEEMKTNPPQKKNYKISAISEIDIPSQNFIGYFHQAKITDLPKLFAEYMPKAGMHAAKNKANSADYTPGAIYTKWDQEKGETEFYIGLFVKNLKPASDMQSVTIPEGKVLTVSKFGNYGDGDMEAHNQIAEYISSNKLEYGIYVWEKYVNDPMEVKPEEIQTNIFYSLK